jgi:carbamoyltransferase
VRFPNQLIYNIIKIMKRPVEPNVLGVYLGHDLGACLLRGGEVACAIEEERLNRFKHGRPNELAGLWGHYAGKFGYFPWASVSYCLEQSGLTIDEIDLVCVGDDLWAAPAKETIASVIPIRDKGKVVYVSRPEGAAHHYHHALGAFCGSAFDNSAVLVVDADGNSTATGYEAESGYLFKNRLSDSSDIFKNRYQSSEYPRAGLGWMYEQVSVLLGFSNTRLFLADAGKTMGLSSWGDPYAILDPWVSYDGYKLSFDGFNHWLAEHGFIQRLWDRGSGLIKKGSEPQKFARDIAAKVQLEVESAILHLAKQLRSAVETDNLCIGGGVALNSVANGKIAASGLFRSVYVQPAANDGGQAIGLAYHGHNMLCGYSPMLEDSSVRAIRSTWNESRGTPHIPTLPMRDAYVGRCYTTDDVHSLLGACGMHMETFESEAVLCRAAAMELAAENVIGWFQGRSEIGPRSLGHRSILGNPAGAHMVETINARVKFRELFRPFAPSVLRERAAEVFDLSYESPYMLFVVDVRPSWRNKVPAITHVDGTARVQTVDGDVDPLYHGLISEFERATGIPLVLNTSFNLRGMPIVETPFDALSCFLSTDMDSLYLGLVKVVQPPLNLIYPRLSDGWTVDERQGAAGCDLVFSSPNAERRVKLPKNAPCAWLKTIVRTGYNDSVADLVNRSGEPDHATARGLLQILVREGAVTIRIGRVIFGDRNPGLHWWQSPKS